MFKILYKLINVCQSTILLISDFQNNSIKRIIVTLNLFFIFIFKKSFLNKNILFNIFFQITIDNPNYNFAKLLFFFL